MNKKTIINTLGARPDFFNKIHIQQSNHFIRNQHAKKEIIQSYETIQTKK